MLYEVITETEQQGEDEQGNTDDPVELARRPVRAGQEDAQHVEHDEDDHQVGAPPVQVPDQLAEGVV